MNEGWQNQKGSQWQLAKHVAAMFWLTPCFKNRTLDSSGSFAVGVGAWGGGGGMMSITSCIQVILSRVQIWRGNLSIITHDDYRTNWKRWKVGCHGWGEIEEGDRGGVGGEIQRRRLVKPYLRSETAEKKNISDRTLRRKERKLRSNDAITGKADFFFFLMNSR